MFFQIRNLDRRYRCSIDKPGVSIIFATHIAQIGASAIFATQIAQICVSAIFGSQIAQVGFSAIFGSRIAQICHGIAGRYFVRSRICSKHLMFDWRLSGSTEGKIG